MIQLEIAGVDADTRRQLERRLHRATVVDSGDDADAIAILGSDQPVDLRDRQLSGKRPVLVTPEAFSDSASWFAALDAHAEAPAVFANPLRYEPSVQLVWRQLESRALGRAGLLRVHCWKADGSDGNQRNDGSWDLEWLCELERALWLMGGAPEHVWCVDQRGGPGTGTDGISARDPDVGGGGLSLHLHCGWPYGGMALLNFSSGLPDGEGYRSLTLVGSSGAAYLDDHANRQLVFNGGAPQTALDSEQLPGQALMLQNFVDGLQTSGEANACGRASDTQEWRQWNDVRRVMQQAMDARDRSGAASG